MLLVSNVYDSDILQKKGQPCLRPATKPLKQMSPRPLFLRGDRLYVWTNSGGKHVSSCVKEPFVLWTEVRIPIQLLCKYFMGCWYNHQYHRRNFSYFLTYHCSLLWEIFIRKFGRDTDI